MLIDPRNTGHLYTTSQNMSVNRFRKSDGWADVSPPADSSETDAVWMVFLEFDPNDSRTVFAGGLRVWRTKDDGNNWSAVSPVLDGSAISAVEIAQADSKSVYIGTEKGGIYRSLSDAGVYVSPDAGNTWKSLTGNLPTVPIVDLVYHELDGTLTAASYGRSIWRLKV